ncbi:hypothetical protein SBA5_430005 [Candidatus Sulfotelmatomonas gaucii]|uniref:Uncharacterized protein n=1 Tax=Candidatus Sulfuritelmatomonas gaucii TaxID=2043161 RepID=A0A2N9LLJ3_9BACT|nr:hypothetical protein SBA5_430005 [Candidatus Sulfotelmatomonas gaucii]
MLRRTMSSQATRARGLHPDKQPFHGRVTSAPPRGMDTIPETKAIRMLQGQAATPEIRITVLLPSPVAPTPRPAGVILLHLFITLRHLRRLVEAAPAAAARRVRPVGVAASMVVVAAVAEAAELPTAAAVVAAVAEAAAPTAAAAVVVAEAAIVVVAVTTRRRLTISGAKGFESAAIIGNSCVRRRALRYSALMVESTTISPG